VGVNFAKAVKQEKKFCDFRICGSKEKELFFIVLSQWIPRSYWQNYKGKQHSWSMGD